MKKISIVLMYLIACPLLAHNDHDWREDFEAQLMVEVEYPSNLKNFVERPTSRIDMGFFKDKLISFAANERNSNPGLDQAREFLMNEYKKLGFVTEFHNFGGGVNFIAEKKGIKSPDKILIISSHIDSVGNKGANDNGTGTIGALSMARVLAKTDHDYTLRILGFDKEEKGLKGSDAYVAMLPDKKAIIGNLNIEMIGFHSKNDGGFHVIDCDKSLFGRRINKPASEFLSRAVKQSVEELTLDLNIVKTCTGRSDHASFWRHNIPAIVISENFFGGDPDPCYHSRCDVVDDRLNYPYMGKILEALLHSAEILLKE